VSERRTNRWRPTRRVFVVLAVALFVGGGIAAFRIEERRVNSVRAACASVRSAFLERGPSVGEGLARAAEHMRTDGRRSDRAFGAAVQRLAARAGVSGTAARPADLATVQTVCGDTIAAESAIITRAPYLTDVTEHSVRVNFATDRSVPAPSVLFGTASGDCTTPHAIARGEPHAVSVGTRTDYRFSVELSGLRAATRYCFVLGPEVFDLSTRESPGRFSTALPPGDPRPFSFAVFGDWGGGTVDEARVLAQVAKSPASFIVTTGDNAYVGGTQSDYGDLTNGNVFGAAEWPQVGSRLPVFLTSGNHGFSNFSAALADFPEQSVVQVSGGRLRPETYCCTRTLTAAHTYASSWYAFDWGRARFYVLDAAWADHTGDYAGDFYAHWNGPVPGCGPCGAELTWLRADLAAHKSTPLKFAFFHYPLHVDATDHLSDRFLAGPDALEGLLARGGVDIVFNGHAHLYERNRPEIAGSPMLSYVTGGGGVGNGSDVLARVSGCDPFNAYAIGAGSTSCRAPRPVDNRHVYHYLLVTVDDRGVTVTPTDETGHSFDVHTWRF
jgi:hypothetical protein